MNCPKCNYPDGPKPGDHYKGLYTPGESCAGCGFQEMGHPTPRLIKEICGYVGGPLAPALNAALWRLSVLELQLLRDAFETANSLSYQAGIIAAGGRLGV